MHARGFRGLRYSCLQMLDAGLRSTLGKYGLGSAAVGSEVYSSEQKHNALEIQYHRRQVSLNAVGNQTQVAAAAKTVPELGFSELALDLVSFGLSSSVLR